MKAGAGVGEPGDPMFGLQAGAQHAIALPEIAWALQERDAKGADSSTKEGHLIPVAFKASHYTRDSDGAPSSIAPPLSADADKGDQDTLIAFDCKASEPNVRQDLAPTLRGMQHQDGNANAGGHAAICFDTVNVTSWANRTRCEPGGPAPTMHGFGEPLTVAFDAYNSSISSDGSTPTMSGCDSGNRMPQALQGCAVRRLTPTECERLQGFKDGWTRIPLRNKAGKPNGKWAKDGPRYRALGNSMAVPVIRWIGRQLDAAARPLPSSSDG